MKKQQILSCGRTGSAVNRFNNNHIKTLVLCHRKITKSGWKIRSRLVNTGLTTTKLYLTPQQTRVQEEINSLPALTLKRKIIRTSRCIVNRSTEKMGKSIITPSSLSVMCYSAFKEDAPLPAKLAIINDDALTVHIMKTMIQPDRNISGVSIELGENIAMFAVAVASGLKDAHAEMTFRKISDMISSIRWTDDDDIFAKIEDQVRSFADNKEYSNFAQQIMTILHTGYNF